MILNIALNYGARQEILRAFKILQEKKILNPTEQDISNNLYTAKYNVQNQRYTIISSMLEHYNCYCLVLGLAFAF